MMGNPGRQFLLLTFYAAKHNGLLHEPKACRPAINGAQPTADRALASPFKTRSGDRAAAMDPHQSRLQTSSGRTRMSMRSAADQPREGTKFGQRAAQPIIVIACKQTRKVAAE